MDDGWGAASEEGRADSVGSAIEDGQWAVGDKELTATRDWTTGHSWRVAAFPKDSHEL
jgi:hypothetical protein